MEPDGPHLINMRLDGLLPPDVVTEKSIARFNQFISKTSIEVAPILINTADEKGFSEGIVSIRLRNNFDEPVEMAATIAGLPLRGLTVDPMELRLTAGPKKTAELQVRVQFAKPVEFEALAHTSLTATFRTTGKKLLTSEQVVPVVIDRRFSLPTLATMPVIDGVIETWPEKSNALPPNPLLLGNRQAWQGPGDATAQFFARQMDGYIYVAVRVTDDNVLPTDHVELLIDPRPVAQRSRNPHYTPASLTIRTFAPETHKAAVSSMLANPVTTGPMLE